MVDNTWKKVTLDNEIQHLFPQYVEDFVVDRQAFASLLLYIIRCALQ